MTVLPNTVRTLCAAYFLVSLAITSIVLQAMWDSFVNGTVGVEILPQGGTEGFKASQSTLSVLSTPRGKVIVCSAISEDETFTVLIASSSVFTAAVQDGNSLWLCNHEGGACFAFVCDVVLERFLGALETP